MKTKGFHLRFTLTKDVRYGEPTDGQTEFEERKGHGNITRTADDTAKIWSARRRSAMQ